MRLIILVVSLLSFWHNSIGQEYLKATRKNVKSMFEKSDSTAIVDSPSGLTITNGYVRDKFIAYYHFDEDQYCDSSSIQYYCSKCAKNFVEFIMDNKKDRWVQTVPGTFISHERMAFDIVIGGPSKNKTSQCKQMTIIETPDKEICTTIIFKLVTMKTSEWNKIMSKR